MIKWWLLWLKLTISYLELLLPYFVDVFFKKILFNTFLFNSFWQTSLWPSAPLVVNPGVLGTALGLMTSMQMIGIGVCSLVVGAILDKCKYVYYIYLYCCFTRGLPEIYQLVFLPSLLNSIYYCYLFFIYFATQFSLPLYFHYSFLIFITVETVITNGNMWWCFC